MSRVVKQDPINAPTIPLMSLFSLLSENSLALRITRIHQLVIELSCQTPHLSSEGVVQHALRRLFECSKRLKLTRSVHGLSAVQKQKKHPKVVRLCPPTPPPLPAPPARVNPPVEPTNPAQIPGARRPVVQLGRLGPFEVFQETNSPHSIVIRVQLPSQQRDATTRCQFSVFMPQLGRAITFIIFYPSSARCIVSIKPRLPNQVVTPQEFVVNPLHVQTQRRHPPPPPPPSSSC